MTRVKEGFYDGKKCPKCKDGDMKQTSGGWDGINPNSNVGYSWECDSCGFTADSYYG